MKIFKQVAGFLTSAALTIGCGQGVQKEASRIHVQNKPSFHDLEVIALNGVDTIKMSQFKGKKVLVVNVASKCGYTPQYETLQSLYEAKNGELVILGLPCNQFLYQEPGTADDIQSFCKLNYGVTFPLTEKIEVKGSNQHQIYQWLTQKTFNGVGDYEVTWNFNKFLISESGELLGYFSSKAEPLGDEIGKMLD
jgi:glutathione peroxidase